MTTLPTCAVAQRWIEQHFCGASERERGLRVHLHGCADCRGYYDRKLLGEQLDPRGLGPEQRLAVGLGIAPRASRRRMHLWVPLAAAALLLLMILPRLHSPAEYHARGGGLDPVGPALWVYRFSPSGTAERVRGEIRRSDELAFAYRGLTEASYLLVFGRDEHGRIYWYYPEWTDTRLDPESIPISTDPVRHELPAAISHELDARELELCGVFSRKALRVQEIERRLAHATARELERMEGTHVRCRALRVSP